MTTNQPESLELRLNRLETIFADMGDVVIAQSEAIASIATDRKLRTKINSQSTRFEGVYRQIVLTALATAITSKVSMP